MESWLPQINQKIITTCLIRCWFFMCSQNSSCSTRNEVSQNSNDFPCICSQDVSSRSRIGSSNTSHKSSTDWHFGSFQDTVVVCNPHLKNQDILFDPLGEIVLIALSMLEDILYQLILCTFLFLSYCLCVTLNKGIRCYRRVTFSHKNYIFFSFYKKCHTLKIFFQEYN